MEYNNEFKVGHQIKVLVAFLASGGFVAVHKKFMTPSPDLFPYGHWTDLFHRYIHFGIGVFLQVLLCLWLWRIAQNIVRKQKPEEGSNKINEVLEQSNESQDQLEHSESVNEKSAEPSSEKSTREQIEPPDGKKQDGSQ